MSAFGTPIYLFEINLPAPAGWTTVTGVRSMHIRRGRQDELATIQSGEAIAILDNNSGYFSPDNAASPFYPYVAPQRGIRLSMFYGGAVFYLFTGYIESVEPLDNTVMDADVRITARDWFSWAALHKLNTSFAAENEGTRIANVIAQVGAHGSTSDIATGPENLLAAALVDTVALTHINDVIAAERGLFFVAADGTLTYHNRHRRWSDADSTVSQATFAQPSATGANLPAGAFPYVASQYILDNRDIFNDIRVNATGTGEGEQATADATSQTTYGVRTLVINSPVMAENQALELAKWLLVAYKDPHARMQALTFDGDCTGNAAPTSAWLQVGQREIGDRITVKRARPGTLGIDADFWIEGVEHVVRDGAAGHTVTWQLSNVASQGTNPWQLDVSALDQTTNLRY
jgi:hypothetical protein